MNKPEGYWDQHHTIPKFTTYSIIQSPTYSSQEDTTYFSQGLDQGANKIRHFILMLGCWLDHDELDIVKEKPKIGTEKNHEEVSGGQKGESWEQRIGLGQKPE